MVRVTPIALLAAWLLAGCEGDVGPQSPAQGAAGSAGNAASGGAAATSCETRPQAAPAPLKILIRGEYERSLRGVLGDAAVDAASVTLAQLSDQKPVHQFRSMAVGTTGADSEARFQISDVVSQALAKAPASLASVAACMGTQPADEACIDELIGQLGLRLFRRPLEAAEQQNIKALYGEGEAIAAGDGLRFAVFALLESPHFIYRLETRGSPSASDASVLGLTPHELASRLSFLLWGAAPDAALLQSAASGLLDSEAGLKGELDRLLGDPRAHGQLGRFFGEWLEFEDLPIVNQSAAFLAGISGLGLSDAMQRELSETLIGLTLSDRAKFQDLYTSPVSYVGSGELAKLYGVPTTPGDGRTSLDPVQRAGMLTRGALLLTSGETTSPIRRGAFVLRKLLCNPIPPPDPNSFPPGAIQPPSFDPNATSRERWTQKTSEPQCAACHSQFNPFGFALEHYDSIGRYRETEPIVDPNTGLELKQLPIDTSVDAMLDGTPVHVESATELGQAFAASPAAQACLATQWLRFGAGRLEQDADACVLQDVAKAIAAGTPLVEALQRVVLAPEFRVRRLGAP